MICKCNSQLNNDYKWRGRFLSSIKSINLPREIDHNGDYQKALKSDICAFEESRINDIFSRHTERVDKDKEFDIKLLLLVLLFMLATKEDTENPHLPLRWVLIFDGIEAYVTVEASSVFNAIADIHGFLELAFDNANKRSDFFTKFTFVFPVRTSTSLSLESFVPQQGKKVWGNDVQYIRKLPRIEFSVAALLKKLKYLAEIDAKLEKPLTKRCVDIVSALITKQVIERYLKDEIKIEAAIAQTRIFAERRLLPILNYDHRSAVEKLCDLAAFYESEENDNALALIEARIADSNCDHDIANNGKNNILLRRIFNKFREDGFFSELGYMDFEGGHTPSIARTLFNFLYYSEVKYRIGNKEQSNAGGYYNGVRFTHLLDKLEPFAKNDISSLSDIIYKASVLNSASKLSISWTHLIVIRGLKKRLDQSDFDEIIRAYYQGNGKQEDIASWRVVLSDAGICFTSWASKQFEFLLSRSNRLCTKPLFAYSIEELNGAVAACKEVIKIIKEEAIAKMVDRCLNDCKYGTSNCDRNCNFQEEILDCSLFQRYQECVFIIKACISYIDRYRVYLFQISKRSGVDDDSIKSNNNTLIGVLEEFNSLFDELRNKIEAEFKEASKFFEKTREIGQMCLGIKLSINRFNESGKAIMNKYAFPNMFSMYFEILDGDRIIAKAFDTLKKYPSDTSLYDQCDLEFRGETKALISSKRIDKIHFD